MSGKIKKKQSLGEVVTETRTKQRQIFIESEREAVAAFLEKKARWHRHRAKDPKVYQLGTEAAQLASQGWHLLEASILIDVARAVREGEHAKKEG